MRAELRGEEVRDWRDGQRRHLDAHVDGSPALSAYRRVGFVPDRSLQAEVPSR